MPLIKQVKVKNPTTGNFVSYDISVDSDNIAYNNELSFKQKIDAVAQKIDESNFLVTVDNNNALQFYTDINAAAIDGDIIYESSYDSSTQTLNLF